MPASSLPNPNIPAVPASPDPNYPTLTSITVADLVGPLAANRQPNELDIRSDTLRDRVNDLSENMNVIATGGGDSFDLFLSRDGSHAMTAELNMGTNRINNLVAGVAGTDGVNVNQLLGEIVVLAAAVVLRDGSQAMTDALDMGSNKIVNLANPTVAGDAVPLGFADTRYINSAGDAMAGVLDMGGNKIVNLTDPNPSNPAEALNIGFADGRYGTIIGSTPVKMKNLFVDIGFDTGLVLAGDKVTIRAGLLATLFNTDPLVSTPTKAKTVLLGSDIVIDINASGAAPVAGGLDTGPATETADTFYFVYLIEDSTGTNPTDGILSLSSSAPALPTGYDLFRRVGSGRNDGSSDFIPANNINGVTHRGAAPNLSPTVAVLVFDISPAADLFVSFSLASVVPPTSQEAFMSVGIVSTSGGGEPAPFAFVLVVGNTDIHAVGASSGGVPVFSGTSPVEGLNSFRAFVGSTQTVLARLLAAIGLTKAVTATFRVDSYVEDL